MPTFNVVFTADQLIFILVHYDNMFSFASSEHYFLSPQANDPHLASCSSGTQYVHARNSDVNSD